MRKIFTQILNFKAVIAMLLFVGASVTVNAQCEVDPPANAIYSHQFDGGLDGWTVTDLNGNPSTVWEWQADGLVSGGAFNATDGVNDTLISPSVCNGAMVMNSDFLDNGGAAPPFGTGTCPCTNSDGSFAQFCDGILSSPVIDLSGATTEVAVQFNQGLRQFNSEYYILLSNDGGNSYYDTIQINDGIPTNSAHILDDVQVIPLCGAAGSEEFTMSFWLRGNYYYWGIDDIALVPSDQPDIRTNENFFAVSPQFGTPFNMTYDIPFLADIENVSAALAIAPELTVSVTDPSGVEVHTETRTYDDVPGCMTDENKPFTMLYTPGTTPDAMGRYGVSYTVTAEGDPNPDNNTQEGVFDITQSEFQKVIPEVDAGSEYLGGIRYSAGAFQSWGSYFYIPRNDSEQSIESVRCGITPADGEELEPGIITVAVYQWVDVNEDGLVNSGDANEKVLLGQADYIVTSGNTDFRDFIVTPLTPAGEMITPEAGTELLVMMHTNPFSGAINYFALNSPAEDERSFYYAATQQAYEELGLARRYGSVGGVGSVPEDADTDRDYFIENRWTNFVNMRFTDIIDGTEDINEELGVTVYPSPASTFVNVDMNLEETSDKVSIELVDMKGQVASTNSFSNVKNDNLTIDVSTLPGGMYLMNIRTEAGMISKKISVIH